MPRLDITKYVKVLGDIYDRNFTAWRTITRFSINADYEAIEYKSFADAKQWFTDFDNADPVTYKKSTCEGANDNGGITQLSRTDQKALKSE
jgi:hypothetical protein